ncbi:MAG: hypothetical protein WB823_21265, partial [Steroidobacteraceae bacterium]
VGRLVGRLDTRLLLAIGLGLCGWAMWDMSGWTPDVSEWTVGINGIIQGAGAADETGEMARARADRAVGERLSRGEKLRQGLITLLESRECPDQVADAGVAKRCCCLGQVGSFA